MKKYLTISTHPGCYDHASCSDRDAINATLTSAAILTGLQIFLNLGEPHRAMLDAARRVELDWYSKWCGNGYNWTPQEWAMWLNVEAIAR